LKPFCAIYSTFLQRGYDQVLHDVCIQNLPVRFFMDRAGLVGDDGPTHHGAFDVAFLTCIPNMVLMAPRDTTELRLMAQFMKDYDAAPIAVRYPRGASDDRLPEQRSPIAFGRAEVLREGKDIVLCAVGTMVSAAWEAAGKLKEQGIDACVINARFIKPLDAVTIGSYAKSCGKLITIEESVRIGGFGQQVRDALIEAGVNVPHTIMALPDHFVEHGAQPLIRRDCGLDAAGIMEQALLMLGAQAKAQVDQPIA